jgi:hypothetical protein
LKPRLELSSGAAVVELQEDDPTIAPSLTRIVLTNIEDVLVRLDGRRSTSQSWLGDTRLGHEH